MSDKRHHLGVLDGWRGISILLVLAAHLLPLGPKPWELNEMAARMGMALFFTLSGFLITRFLLADSSIGPFLIRRVCRIVPLAWLTLAVSFALARPPFSAYLPNFLFYANVPPYHLTDFAAHFWSLGVEMQFYAAVALIVGILGVRGLYLLPILCIAVTLHRVASGAYMEIVTWHRIDEILAGATLALIHEGKLGGKLGGVVARSSGAALLLVLALFAVSSHPAGAFMNYFRPYLAALLVGRTLFEPPPRVGTLLRSGALKYIAAISFALYVFHGLLAATWLGTGDKIVKYLKRPLLLAATFALAHVSTFYYEARWIELGRRLSNRVRSARP